MSEPDYKDCKCGRAIHPDIADICPKFMKYHIEKAEKEQLARTNGVAGALYKMAERASRKQHKHWYLKLDRKNNVAMVDEEEGKYLQDACATTIKTVKLKVAEELETVIDLRSQGVWRGSDAEEYGCSVVPTRELLKLYKKTYWQEIRNLGLTMPLPANSRIGNVLRRKR